MIVKLVTLRRPGTESDPEPHFSRRRHTGLASASGTPVHLLSASKVFASWPSDPEVVPTRMGAWPAASHGLTSENSPRVSVEARRRTGPLWRS
jgi:hypothetical protein